MVLRVLYDQKGNIVETTEEPDVEVEPSDHDLILQVLAKQEATLAKLVEKAVISQKDADDVGAALAVEAAEITVEPVKR